MSNVTEELIVAYITDNLDENKKSQVLYEIENNPELMKLYKELKSIRDDQEKIVSDFISRPIPDKTLKLFENKKKESSLIERIKKGYLTLIGWLGFVVTSTLLILPSTQMQLATFRGSESELQIAKLEKELLELQTQVYTFRGLDNDLTDTSNFSINESKKIEIDGKNYDLKIISINNFNTETCVNFSLISEDNDEILEEICIDK
tara:strand:- start:1198 stop:1812 length:615 start_codon:yes stop_codon:yes gene_type:complete